MIFKDKNNFYIFIALLSIIVNLAIIFGLIRFAWHGNDKAILVIIIFYFVLILLNALIWFILHLLQKTTKSIFRFSTLGLILCYFPVILISTQY